MNFLIGQKLIKQKEFGKALSIFLSLEKNNSQDIRIYFYLGIIYFELNKFNESIIYYKKFLKKEPNSVGALHNLAIVKQSIGKIDSAKNIYLKLIEIDKNKIRPYYGLFTLNPKYLNEEKFEDILKIKKNYKLSSYEDGIVNFILSKKEKKNKNYLNEVEYLKKFHSSIFNSNHSYNMSSQFYYNQVISKYYNKIKITNNQNNSKKKSYKPIFIVGLPRSGSTLIESILTSGINNFISYGESHTFNMSILEQIGPKIYKNNFEINNFDFKIDLQTLTNTIIKSYSQFNDSNKNHLFVDKSLENFFNIEIILNVFPNAKFLHTFRNPLDSVISIYQSMLPELSWTHTINDILIYLDNYYKVIDYFKLKYPEKIMDIDLEKFTKNSVDVSKDIYKFCNLNWSKEILDFYKRDDLLSKTLSFAQIRNKITKYSDNKYLPYYYLLKDYKKKYNWININ